MTRLESDVLVVSSMLVFDRWGFQRFLGAGRWPLSKHELTRSFYLRLQEFATRGPNLTFPCLLLRVSNPQFAPRCSLEIDVVSKYAPF